MERVRAGWNAVGEMANEIRLDHEHFDFEAREKQFADTADEELGEPLRLARAAVGYLADGLWHIEVPEPADPAKARWAHQAAVFGLCAIGIRSARAVILLVRTGWEPEAHGPMRRLSEAYLRCAAVLADHSGEAARQWLDGKGPRPGKLFKAEGSSRWDILSSGAHADYRSLMLSTVPPMWVPSRETMRAVSTMPGRERDHAHGLLLEVATRSMGLLAGIGEAFDRPLVDSFMHEVLSEHDAYAERSELLRNAGRVRRAGAS